MSELGRSPECVSDLALDRLLSGELTGTPARAVRAHLAGCSACEARRAELAADREAFAAGVPPLDALIGAQAPAPGTSGAVMARAG
ncbi:MAG TPA: zf-HC2 domain-containing protein, partial [Polyangiaceae bacterium]|nr:zf-HC2 domain-containing protein [Polyangiaceae bacterium]